MLMGGGYDQRMDVVSVAEPRYTLHSAEFRDYRLHIKCDELGEHGIFVHAVTDKKGKKVTEPDLPPEGLRISFSGGGNYVPLELRLE